MHSLLEVGWPAMASPWFSVLRLPSELWVFFNRTHHFLLLHYSELVNLVVALGKLLSFQLSFQKLGLVLSLLFCLSPCLLLAGS